MSEPRIKAFRLWERESRNGNRYFAGYLGPMGVIIFRDDTAEPREGVIAEWQVYFTERDDAYRQPRAAAAQQPRPARKVQRRKRPAPADADPTPLDDPIDDIGRGR